VATGDGFSKSAAGDRHDRPRRGAGDDFWSKITAESRSGQDDDADRRDRPDSIFGGTGNDRSTATARTAEARRATTAKIDGGAA